MTEVNQTTPPMHLPELGWPHLSPLQITVMVMFNVGSVLITVIALRYIWRSPTPEEIERKKEIRKKIEALIEEENSRTPLIDQKPSTIECAPGDVAGDYSKPWTETVDIWILVFTVLYTIAIIIVTVVIHPKTFVTPLFILTEILLGTINFVVLFGSGMLARYFCEVDEKGYIITNNASPFKVNYTRKIVHIVLICSTSYLEFGNTDVPKVVYALWNLEVILLTTVIVIKPLRENVKLFMIMFNANDRPEDRPNTLLWCHIGNTFASAVTNKIFQWIFHLVHQTDMTIIVVLILGLGDGLAEPVGIYFGKHIYWVRAWCTIESRRYQRSFEGSSCVWICSIVFISIFFYLFQNEIQFWITLVILPPLMTLTEAVSPHTLDNCFLIVVGDMTLILIRHLKVMWQQ